MRAGGALGIIFGMKKHLMLAWAAVAFTGLAFANNVAAIVKWWVKFSETGGDAVALHEGIGGFFRWLDWSVVDYSGVTTFIPFLGCVCIARGIGRIVSGRKCRPEVFPFFRGADQFNVALGLFGTLWGIIVIGYFQLDKVTMADLMQCLHTALFSTLAAVVWVFMIDHPLVRPWMRRRLLAAGLSDPEDGDLTGALDAFTAKLKAVTDGLAEREKAFEESMRSRLAEFERSFAEQIVASRASLDKSLAEAERSFADHQVELEKAMAVAQSVALKAINDRNAEADVAFAERQKRYDTELEKRIAAYEQEAADRLSALRLENEQERERHRAEVKSLTESVEQARADARNAEETCAKAVQKAEESRSQAVRKAEESCSQAVQKAEEVRARAVRKAEEADARAVRAENKLSSIRCAFDN